MQKKGSERWRNVNSTGIYCRIQNTDLFGLEYAEESGGGAGGPGYDRRRVSLVESFQAERTAMMVAGRVVGLLLRVALQQGLAGQGTNAILEEERHFQS